MIKPYFSNIPGWRTKRKIVVIESDDWGSIRLPSKEIRDKYIKNGIRLDKNYFTNYDSLESENDVYSLLDTLDTAGKDKNGRKPVVTMLSLPCNPDFFKIKESEFDSYFFEPVSATYDRYNFDTLGALKEGFLSNLITAELHGREHLNINRWLKCLRSGKYKITEEAFEDGFYGIQSKIAGENRSDYQAAFDFTDNKEIDQHKIILSDAVRMFKLEYEKHVSLFVPPNGPYSNKLEEYLINIGIKYINVAKNRMEPMGEGKYKKRFQYLGQLQESGLIAITRNVIFEPAKGGEEELSKALKYISIAFKLRKPAIISSHRANFVGEIDDNNRSSGNLILKKMLQSILKKWPDVEFMTTVELGNLIRKDKSLND